jgi:plasmid maintenance system antidote protein VapI
LSIKHGTMTRKEYLAALDKLRLGIASKATAEALGLSLRQIQRLAAGEQDISGSVERLLKMYLKHGLPKPRA